MPNRIRWMLGLLTTLAVCGCGNHTAPATQEGSILRRGLGGEPASLDPSAAADTFSVQVVQDLYEGLLREAANGETEPAVATAWTLDASGTTYSFKLRSSARWSNGEPVRAQNFVTAWQRVVDPKTGSSVSNDLRPIAGAAEIISGKAPPSSLGVVAVNDNELLVKLSHPTPYFPQLLAHSSTFPVYSDASARSHSAKDWVSNGAYVLADWRPGSRLDLTKNEQYWDRDRVQIQKVQYQIAPDQYVQFAAYRAGQLDLTDTIPPNALSSLQAEHPSEVVIAPYSAVAYYGLNMTAPAFAKNPKLRIALGMAIDRRRIVDALAAGQVEAFGFVPPGIWNYNSAKIEWENLPDSEREAEAKRLYRESGYSIERPLHLQLLFNSNPAIKQTATLVAAMWHEQLGVQTTLTDEEFRVFLESRKDKKRWDVLRLSWDADYNDASNFLDIFRSDSANNDTGYSSTSFDAALNRAANTLDPDARRVLLESAEKLMLSDAPAIPLYFYVSKHLVKPYVLGLTPNSFDRIRSQSLSLAAR